MEVNPIQNDARKQRRRERLGADAYCLLCGCNDLTALTQVQRSLFEKHHVAGRKIDELTVTVCLNCHRALQEGLKDAGLEERTPPTLLHRLLYILTAFADFFRQLADRCADWARRLARLIRRLDEALPSWRDAVEGESP